jgi:hypothetical protein
MMSSEEAQALGRSEFWDERYAKADSDKPTHEWFRAFDALEPFFEKYLFQARGDEGKSGKMLHLGSGDSVSYQFVFSIYEHGFALNIPQLTRVICFPIFSKLIHD